MLFSCFDSASSPRVLLQLRQRRVAAGDGLGTGLGNTIKYERRTASGAAGNCLGTTMKYLRRLRNNFLGNDMGTTIKYLKNTAAAEFEESLISWIVVGADWSVELGLM
jgi:hypothetical protein